MKTLQLIVTVGMDHGVANYPQDADNSEDLIRIADERPVSTQARTRRTRRPRPVPRDARARCHTQPRIRPQTGEALHAAPAPFRSRPNALLKNEKNRQPRLTPAPSAPALPRNRLRPKLLQIIGSLSRAAPVHYAAKSRTRLYDRNQRLCRSWGTGRPSRPRAGPGLWRSCPRAGLARGSDREVLAVLHVPILPPVRVNLKPVWSQRTNWAVFA